MATLNLCLEVSGCPTSCLHCWARGHAYAPMPLDDIDWTLKQSRHFCDTNGITLEAYPMHEVLHHPQAAEVLNVFAACVPGIDFNPIATDGVSLALRED